MKKEKCLEAKIVKVISFHEESGYRRNFRKEDQAWETVKRRNIERDVWSGRDSDMLRDEYEYELSMQSSWGDVISQDDWSGETYIKSYERWIDNTLLIEYQYNGITYETEIERESYKEPYKVGQTLYITINIDEPEIIKEIYDNKYINSLLYAVVLCILVGLLSIITITVSNEL